jgi:predicted SprT family Zn-dependent metalloprotease
MKRKRAQMIARDLMRHFGLTDWSLKFDRAATRFGVCRSKLKQIGISERLAALNGEAELIDTVLHEIAHALAGTQAGHGRLWKVTAMSIGARPERCCAADVVTPPATFAGTCPCCKKTVHRFQRRRIACGTCCRKYNAGKFAPAYLFQWTRRKGD